MRNNYITTPLEEFPYIRSSMSRLKLYDLKTPSELILKEREGVYLNLNASQLFFKTLQLNSISVAMNGGKPLKVPQGKGIIIRKPNG